LGLQEFGRKDSHDLDRGERTYVIKAVGIEKEFVSTKRGHEGIVFQK